MCVSMWWVNENYGLGMTHGEIVKWFSLCYCTILSSQPLTLLPFQPQRTGWEGKLILRCTL